MKRSSTKKLYRIPMPLIALLALSCFEMEAKARNLFRVTHGSHGVSTTGMIMPAASSSSNGMTMRNTATGHATPLNTIGPVDMVEFKVSGRIVDDTGEPIPGVNVIEKGSTNGTTTDVDGGYTLLASSGDATLIFSFIGFATQELAIAGQSEINVKLLPDSKTLGEVVVMGYGTQKKANLTGSVATVSEQTLQDRPVTNVTTALQGTMSGVTVIQNGGQPGKENAAIRVRGIGTLNNSDAMIVVDGVISSMNDVNPNDIETITVLKDAASAAIYGSRASNGVVLITTHRGKSGEAVVRYKGYIGVQEATRLPEFLPQWKAGQFYNEALANEGKPARYTDQEIETFRNGSDPDRYSNTDWLDLFYQGSGVQQSHFVDVSSGSDKIQTFLSMGYFNQAGIVENTNLSRYTTRFKISNNIGQRLRVNGNLAYNMEDFTEPINPYTNSFEGMMWQINRIGRNVPYKYSNGYYGYYDDGNPMAWLESGSVNDRRVHYLRGNVDADVEILKGLHFKPLIGYRMDLAQSKAYINDIQYYDWTNGSPTFYQGPNSLTSYTDNLSVLTLQALLQYDKKFGDHAFSLLGGYSQEQNRFSYLQGYRKAFLNNSLQELNAGPLAGQSATGSANELALQSVFGRVNYTFKEKYLFEANIRYDGSSRFAPDQRWGTYPSFSAGWRMSEEAFFDGLRSVVPDLKVRASWGKLGNQNIVGNYPYIPTISSGLNYAFGNTVATGVGPVNGANPNIHWEDTQSTDIGIDAAFLEGSLTVTADYYVRNTDNILLNIPVGSVYGFNPPVQNGGKVQNRGVELDLGYRGSAGEFKYQVTANTAFVKNTVKDLRETDPIINSYTFMKVGLPVNSFYGYEAVGIFQTEEQLASHATQTGGVIGVGDLMYKDQNNDGVIDGDDRVYIGNYFPKVTYGLTANLQWKGFDFSLFLQGAGGVKGFIRSELMGMVSDKYGKPTTIFENHWTPDNPTNEFPRLWSSYTQNDPGTTPSSFWVRDASYLRVKNIQLGYTLSAEWLKVVGVKSAKIYYSGQNLLTFSSFYKWVDPEAPPAARGDSYPQVLVNSIGLDIKF